MHNAEVEELYEMVPVGAKVIIIGARPSWATEGDVPDTPGRLRHGRLTVRLTRRVLASAGRP